MWPAYTTGMTRLVLGFALLAILLPALPTGAGNKQTLTGSYVWNSGRPSKLKAVFTATGEDRWDVAFHFRFRSSPETFRGTAEGSLSGGTLKGEVKNRGGRGSRTFSFHGEFENGTFRGTHAEVFGRRESSTGSLTLKGQGPPAPGVL